MFAIPEHAVLPPLSHHPLSPIGLVRSVSSDSPRWRELLVGADADVSGAGALASAGWSAPLAWDDPRVTIWLSVWPRRHRRQARHYHGYDAPQGAFAVLSGQVLEQSNGRARILRPGQVRIFGPGYRHSVRNVGVEPAVTVHVQIDHLSQVARAS